MIARKEANSFEDPCRRFAALMMISIFKGDDAILEEDWAYIEEHLNGGCPTGEHTPEWLEKVSSLSPKDWQRIIRTGEN